MATYKVPQDVEAEDKLLGPFTFRQFVYLMIVFGLIMVSIALFQVFPLLIIIPVPIAIFFAVLALPLRKDQPMETYLAALISFYTKPKTRYWIPGQSESTILITAPKKTEPNRVRDITGDEASNRLSFLADIVDSEGRSIKSSNSILKDEFYAEANNATDMFDNSNTFGINKTISAQQAEHREAIINQMRNAIASSSYNQDNQPPVSQTYQNQTILQPRAPENPAAAVTVQPNLPNAPATPPAHPDVVSQKLTALANNPNLSVKTIQKEADRIRKENESEVYVSLH